jgi:hypothetical protein
MDTKGDRVRKFFTAEAQALIESYKNIETLIPSSVRKGAAHTGEEGRYIESLIRSFLNRHLPKSLRALSGFIMRPATKTGTNDKIRKMLEDDSHSRQLDIIIYDIANYPVYEQFEEFAIVPPEGVIAIISVKKNLYKSQVIDELKNLAKAAFLCRHTNQENSVVRGPNLSLISISTSEDPDDQEKKIFSDIQKISGVGLPFDCLVNQIIVLDSYTIFKARPSSNSENVKTASYVYLGHDNEDDRHKGLQLLLTGILSVYHDPTRSLVKRPGFTSFNSGHDKPLGDVAVSGLRCKEYHYFLNYQGQTTNWNIDNFGFEISSSRLMDGKIKLNYMGNSRDLQGDVTIRLRSGFIKNRIMQRKIFQ